MPHRRNRARPTGALGEQLSEWAAKQRIEVDAANALRALLTWSRLHGFVSLEIAGNYASTGIDPNLLFEAELNALPP